VNQIPLSGIQEITDQISNKFIDTQLELIWNFILFQNKKKLLAINKIKSNLMRSFSGIF